MAFIIPGFFIYLLYYSVFAPIRSPSPESEARMPIRPKTALSLILLLVSGSGSAPAQDDPAPNRVSRWRIDQEAGVVFSGYNDVRIPGDTGTRFSLSRDLETDSKLVFRTRISYLIRNRHTISGTFAPLTLDASGTFDEPVRFQGVVFPADSEVNGEYRFANYRLSYRYDFLLTPGWEAGLGVTGFIRDAEISLSDEDLSAEKKNVGFVPLVNFRVRRILSTDFSLILEGDALAAPQGRAEDASLTLHYRPVSNFRLKVGYRILEGGADNDEVYNFALLHYAIAGAILEF